MNGLTKNKIAAIIMVLYSLPSMIQWSGWIANDSPQIVDMGVSFALSGVLTLMIIIMCAPGVWQDYKVYKIITMVVSGLNALAAAPGILFAPTMFFRLSAIGGVVFFVIILVLLLRRTPQPVTA
jgi:hypothetical protein